MTCQVATTACKDIDETVALIFDFTTALGTATIVSQTITCETIIGTDEDADDLLDGASSIVAKTVKQWLHDGLVGVTYHIRCIIVTSDGRDLVGAKNIAVYRR